MIRFHALAPYLHDELGHWYIYHLCFRSAIQTLGFAYKGYINKKCSIQNLPTDWERCLEWEQGKNPFEKILQCFKRTLCFSRIFRRKPQKEESRVFFLEALCTIDLAALTLSLFFFSKRRDHFWLLLRIELRQKPLIKKIYRSCFRLIQKRMGKRFVLLSDSERVGLYYEQLVHQPVHVVPIPHTEARTVAKRVSNKLTLWWPGRPDLEKGADKIQVLARQTENGNAQIYLSELAKQWIQNPSSNLKFLNPVLTREEYIAQFERSDGILLPYDPNEYHSKTSGIFVEAVFMGIPPFVVEGSWLANELHKHNLSELILDWTRPDLLTHINELLKDQTVRNKFDSMREAYLTYHCLPTYTQVLRDLINNSQIDCT